MSFETIAGISTVSYVGDFTAGIDPSLKKAFGIFFFPVHFSSSESEELNNPNFLIGAD